RIQVSLKKQLIAEDRFSWKLPVTGEQAEEDDACCGESLRYIAGVDLSFSKNDPSIACATLVVLDSSTFEVVHEDSAIVELRVPYVSGFLAFREAPVILELLQKMKNNGSTSYPQVLMVDGNGILHPKGFGLACHVGVLADLPTIGIGKNLHHVDGLTQSRVNKQLRDGSPTDDTLILVGDSGATLGAAMRSTDGSTKPVFVSVGHCISLDSAIKIVKFCCRYRVPEPVRQADIRSKIRLR
ncbi:hypothetical protein M569_09729, partial [Genlisea aurea]